MAEKGFGVKEINLIGPSGTPTITSPNNLNLNANNVAISTNVSIGGTLSVTGNVSVGGTLTYEDVTNIDSVGLITARSGLIASGISTFSETVNFTRSGTAIDITQGELEIGGGIIRRDGKLRLWFYDAKDSWYYAGNVSNGAIGEHKFKVVNTDKFIISNTGVNVSGICTATTFSGSGASLTNVPAADPTATDVQVAYTVTANGSSAYRFAGNGVVSTADNPDLYLIRGQKYRFINNSGGSHPFQIRESSGGTAYSTGVTNNGAASGNIDFAPTFDSPAQIVYQCTSHGGMVGNIYLRDAGGQNTNVGVTTFSGGITASGNASFAGNNVTMTASGSPNSLNVAGTSRFEIASIENAEIDGEIAHSGDTDTKISFDTNTIKFDTAGSERLRISSTGVVTKPSQPILLTNMGNGFGGVGSLTTNTANTGILQSSAQIDRGDTGWTTSGSNAYTFVCPVDGIYAVNAHVSYGNIGGGRKIWVMSYTLGGGNLPLSQYVEVMDHTSASYANYSYYNLWEFTAGTRIGMGRNNGSGTISGQSLQWGIHLVA